jgi:hypothetical protein
MGLFRALNLLQGVEAQTTSGTALETILAASPARESEFGAMLSVRHMARRMAGNPLTMAAINSSDSAIRVVFEQTSRYNYSAIEEITQNETAMLSTSTILESLGAVLDNPTAWSYYSTSPFYEDNILNTLTTIIGQDPANYATLSSLILDPSTMLAMSISARAMRALVASKPAMMIVTSNSDPMGFITGDENAMLTVANSDMSMRLISNSQVALDEVTDASRLLLIGVPSALFILGANETAWAWLLSTSTTLNSNIYRLLIAFGALDDDVFGNVADIFADTAASFAVANSKPAMMALLQEPAALATMIASDNLGTVLGSLVAIEEIAGSVTTMQTLITDSVGFPILLASSIAKEAIFASTVLFDTMMTSGSASFNAVAALAEPATLTNDASIGTFQSAGIDGNIIILTGVMGSIVATTLDNTFKGDTQAPHVVAVPGTSLSSGPVDIIKPFTNAKWDINSVAATAAAAISITYVDFN